MRCYMQMGGKADVTKLNVAVLRTRLIVIYIYIYIYIAYRDVLL